MTREEYGNAYLKDFSMTVRFLVSRGLPYDTATETAQAAWAKGWGKISQLRNPEMLLTWMNSIALNIHRSFVRHSKEVSVQIPELHTFNLEGTMRMDVKRILSLCTPSGRKMLRMHYLEGLKISEIAEKTGYTETAIRIKLMRARQLARRKLADLMKRRKHSAIVQDRLSSQQVLSKLERGATMTEQTAEGLTSPPQGLMFKDEAPVELTWVTGKRLYVAGINSQAPLETLDDQTKFVRCAGSEVETLVKSWPQDLWALVILKGVGYPLRGSLLQLAERNGVVCIAISSWGVPELRSWLEEVDFTHPEAELEKPAEPTPEQFTLSARMGASELIDKNFPLVDRLYGTRGYTNSVLKYLGGLIGVKPTTLQCSISIYRKTKACPYVKVGKASATLPSDIFKDLQKRIPAHWHSLNGNAPKEAFASKATSASSLNPVALTESHREIQSLLADMNTLMQRTVLALSNAAQAQLDSLRIIEELRTENAALRAQAEQDKGSTETLKLLRDQLSKTLGVPELAAN